MPKLDADEITKAKAAADPGYLARVAGRSRRRDIKKGALVPSQDAVSYRVKANRYGHEFTRCGITFPGDGEVITVPAEVLTHEQRAHLLNSKPRDLLVVEVGPKGPGQSNSKAPLPKKG